MLRVVSGEVRLLFAFDVGLGVRLDDARARLAEQGERTRLRHQRRAPAYFQFETAPLRLREEPCDVLAGGRTFRAAVGP